MSACRSCGFAVALFGTKQRPLCGGCQAVEDQNPRFAALARACPVPGCGFPHCEVCPEEAK